MELPRVLGITGSIGTGKSTVAKMLRSLRIPVVDADQIVHQLYETSPGVREKLGTYQDRLLSEGRVNRRVLADLVVKDPSFLAHLEALIHPLVKQALIDAIASASKAKVPLLVLDVPLLFEGGLEELCHFTLVTHCSDALQKKRVLRRPSMTEAQFLKILARQLPQPEKISRADFTLDTSYARVHIFKELLKHLKKVCPTHA